MKIPNAKPWITDLEAYYVDNAIRTGWLTYHGKYHQQLEEELADFIGCKYVALVSNGTVACYTLMKYVEQTVGHCNVMVPDLTYVATLNAVLFTKLRPILVDVNPKTWNMDCSLLGDNVNKHFPDIVFAVDLYGNPSNYRYLKEFYNKRFDDYALFDSAECFGGKYNTEEKVGSIGLGAAFSGYANKTITFGGEGGFISTNNEGLNEFARGFRGLFQDKKPYEHSEPGFNFRLTNIQAAFGLAQLRRFNEIQAEKERVFSRYLSGFANTHVQTQQLQNMKSHHSKWVFACLVKNKKAVEQHLKDNGVETRPFFKPLHTLPFTRGINFMTRCYTPFSSVSQQLYDGGIVLPSYPELKNSQIDLIIKIILESDK